MYKIIYIVKKFYINYIQHGVNLQHEYILPKVKADKEAGLANIFIVKIELFYFFDPMYLIY